MVNGKLVSGIRSTMEVAIHTVVPYKLELHARELTLNTERMKLDG